LTSMSDTQSLAVDRTAEIPTGGIATVPRNTDTAGTPTAPRTASITTSIRTSAIAVFSGTRLVLAIAALAIGVFGLGITEFAVMGLLSEIGAGLGATSATVGNAISAYALGVVVGAPLISVLGARIPRKRLLLGLVLLFIVGNGLTALAPTIATFETARFLSGLPHGAFFGLAAVTAASMVSPAKRGRAISAVSLGLTIANVMGVPAATWLGQNLGWRWAFVVVVAVGVITFVSVAAFVPRGRVRSDAGIRRELSALQSGQLWVGMAIGAVGAAGMFCVFSYISPIATQVSGVPIALVPWVLVLFGLGMTAGTILGGRLADWSVDRAIPIALAFMAVLLVAFGFVAPLAWASYAGAFAIGFGSQLLGAPLQLRLMDAAPQAPSLASAMNQASFNIANAVGAAAGGFVISAGAPLVVPAFLGAAFALGGLAIALTAHRVVLVGQRRFALDTRTGTLAIVPVAVDRN
jgi:MFS transporter, DHA1 family, inner membrane transport protein